MYLREVSIRREAVSDWDRYPFSVPAIRALDRLRFRSNVAFFVGENGSGKSTLLEAIAYQCGFSTAGGGRSNLLKVDATDAALGDYVRQLAFLRLIHDLGNAAQWIIATHSPIILGCPGAQIFSFDSAPPAEVPYEETPHFQITRGFLEHRERVLEELFRD